MTTQTISVSGFGRLTNPYKIETIRDAATKEVYEVIYYLAFTREPFVEITNSDLTPFVFSKGKLLGWGWDFYEQLTEAPSDAK